MKHQQHINMEEQNGVYKHVHSQLFKESLEVLYYNFKNAVLIGYEWLTAEVLKVRFTTKTYVKIALGVTALVVAFTIDNMEAPSLLSEIKYYLGLNNLIEDIKYLLGSL